MLKLLISIRKGIFYNKNPDFKISDELFNVLLTEALDCGYVQGFSPIRAIGSPSGYKAINARITSEGLQFIETIITNKLVTQLVNLADNEDIEIASLNSTQIEEKLELRFDDILPSLDVMEEDGLITISNKKISDDVLCYCTIQLTEKGYKAYSRSVPHIEDLQQTNLYINQGTQNQFNNSTIFYGDVAISDSFKKEIHQTTELTESQKQDLIDLIEQLRLEINNDQDISKTGKHLITDFLKKMGSKATETALSQAITLLVKGMIS